MKLLELLTGFPSNQAVGLHEDGDKQDNVAPIHRVSSLRFRQAHDHDQNVSKSASDAIHTLCVRMYHTDPNVKVRSQKISVESTGALAECVVLCCLRGAQVYDRTRRQIPST